MFMIEMFEPVHKIYLFDMQHEQILITITKTGFWFFFCEFPVMFFFPGSWPLKLGGHSEVAQG